MPFEKQFVLSKSKFNDSWNHRSFGKWILSSCPSLPVTESEGGVFLGWRPGRFVAITFSGEDFELQMDECGFYSVVYSPSSQVVASTPGLIEADPGFRYDIPAKDLWYPFGLTGRKGVHRLLPNHALRNFEPVRFQNPARLPPGDDAELARQIAGQLRANVESACRNKAEIDLTAGKDARMVLAAARNVDALYVTTRLPDFVARMDCRIASRISREFGLRHEIREYIEPVGADLDQWLEDTGHCVAGRTWQAVTNSKSAPRDVVRIKGLCGEICRGYYWQEPETTAGPEQLIRRLSLPVAPEVVDSCEKWMEDAGGTWEQILDLAYIEQRLGCWAGPSLHGHHYHLSTFSPFNDRKIIAWMQQLTPAYRKEGRMPLDVISHLWPELLDVPFNPKPNIPVRAWRKAKRMLRRYRDRAGQ